MTWYYYTALLIVLPQLLFVLQVYNNYRYVLSKHKRNRSGYRPRSVLFVPCKGLDSNFERNVKSFFDQDYENYLLWFVVGDKSDPAYDELFRLKEHFIVSSKAQDVQILVAGQGQLCSQKVHNLLYCYERLGEDVEVMAFADSDICLRSDWLSHIVYPLRQAKTGASSGYRWVVPRKHQLSSLALSAVNAKVAQLLGNTRFKSSTNRAPRQTSPGSEGEHRSLKLELKVLECKEVLEPKEMSEHKEAKDCKGQLGFKAIKGLRVRILR